ncbi:MAG: phage major capsid protein [Gemmatimonadetes bacterium]|nr:phage major capsid protein [Gemmatimonadota bacterium]
MKRRLLTRMLHNGRRLTIATNQEGEPMNLRELLTLAGDLLKQARKALKAGETEKAERLMRDHESTMSQYRALDAMGARTTDPASVQDPNGPEARASLGRIVGAVLEGRETDGAERELQEEHGLTSHQVPLSLLATRAVTPAPADTQANQAAIIPEVFPAGVANFLGIARPTVPVGESVYPLLTTGATAHAPAADGEAAESTGAFTATKLEPGRLQASFRFRREDLAVFAGMEMSLRDNLSMALSSALDDRILYGGNAGLLSGGLGAAPDAPGAVATWADFVKGLTDNVDGRYASRPDQVRYLLGADSYALSETVFGVGNANRESAYEMLLRKSGGVRVTSRIADPAAVGAVSDVQDALTARAMGATHAVAPLWEGVSLIRDELTQAATGRIVLTAVMLYAFAVVRADGFRRVRFKTAA